MASNIVWLPFPVIAEPEPTKPDFETFVRQNLRLFLGAMFRSDIGKPKAVNSLEYRMLGPRFLSRYILKIGDPPLITEAERQGLPYDWLFDGTTRLSVKETHTEVFPRKSHRGSDITKGSPVQLKNTRSTPSITDGSFDYLVICEIISEKSLYRLSIIPFEKVRESLKRDDSGGFDGLGQIKYRPQVSDCILHETLDPETRGDLKDSFAKQAAVTIEERNAFFNRKLAELYRETDELTAELRGIDQFLVWGRGLRD